METGLGGLIAENESFNCLSSVVLHCLPGRGVATPEALAHQSLATTDRYVRHLAPQQVIEVMRARSWEL